MTAGEPNFSGQLNASYIEVYANGSQVESDCFIDITKTPIQVTNITKIDDTSFAGPITDTYVLFNGQQYRSYVVIGIPEQIKEG